ncbi:MAG: dicarboxylate/amino acid:cation symporter [Bacteroidales bacterium]
MTRIKLHWQILAALVFALLYGIFLRDYTGYVEWMGTIFLRALNMIIIPLVFSSIVNGVMNIGNARNIGRLGLKTMGYYLSTSIIAIFTGLILVNLFSPGTNADLNLEQSVELAVTGDSFGVTLIKIIPDNIFSAFSDNSRMLSVIFFALLFGFFTIKVSKNHQSVLIDFFGALFDVMMKLTAFVIRFTPFGIFGLVAGTIAQHDNLIVLFESLGLYMAVVLMAIFFHAFVSLPLILLLYGKINPLRHFISMRIPLLTAFSTSSSNATLPLTMDAVENNTGVSNKISSFTLPLGATINMDGTALYECVAVMFIAQAYGFDLSITQQMIVVATALLASIGAAGIPMAGLVMITIILTAVGLPLEGVGLILAVDRILDMFRTAANVWSDSCAAAVIANSEGETLNA